MSTAPCPGVTPSGQACRAVVPQGKTWCRWHDPSSKARARVRAEAAKGGRAKAFGSLPSTSPVADVLDLDTVNVATAEGLMTVLGATVRQLCRLPLDVRTANALAQCVTAARPLIESAAFESRLAALERGAGLRDRARAS